MWDKKFIKSINYLYGFEVFRGTIQTFDWHSELKIVKSSASDSSISIKKFKEIVRRCKIVGERQVEPWNGDKIDEKKEGGVTWQLLPIFN